MAVMAQTSQQLPSSHRRCSMLRMCLLHRNQADKCTALDDSMHADRIRVYLQDPLSPLLLPGRQTVQAQFKRKFCSRYQCCLSLGQIATLIAELDLAVEIVSLPFNYAKDIERQAEVAQWDGQLAAAASACLKAAASACLKAFYKQSYTARSATDSFTLLYLGHL